LERISVPARVDWQKRVEELGFNFHTIVNGDIDPVYWDESHAYKFTTAEIENIENSTQVLYRMCLSGVDHVVSNKLYNLLKIPEAYQGLVQKSWERQDVDLYGRFDLAFNEAGQVKMLEFNADTPTSLFEASVVQWFWLESYMAANNVKLDQFNSIHEKLGESYQYVKEKYLNGTDPMYFACLKNQTEDFTTVEYLRDVAIQSGINAKHIYLEDVGWNGKTFTDLDEKAIRTIFKLYPWEMLVDEQFGSYLLQEPWDIIEPAWKLILSNKAILPILWELYPDHPNLLPSYRDSIKLGTTYVRKPVFSREGANIAIIRNGVEYMPHDAGYDKSGHIYQEYLPMKKYDGFTPVLGSWIIGGRAAGLGIREDVNEITGNTSHFVPHLIID